jgi:DNA-binding NarL/FixJ family response regulator
VVLRSDTILPPRHYAEELRARGEQADTLFARVASLTPRERQVFALVVRGMLNKPADRRRAREDDAPADAPAGGC